MVGNQLAAAFGQNIMLSLAIRPSALTLLVCTSLLSTGLAGTRLLPGVFVLFRKERALQSTQAPLPASAATKPDLLRIMMLDCSSVRLRNAVGLHGVQGSRASLAAFGALDTAPHCAGEVAIIFLWRSLCLVSTPARSVSFLVP